MISDNVKFYTSLLAIGSSPIIGTEAQSTLVQAFSVVTFAVSTVINFSSFGNMQATEIARESLNLSKK